MNGHKFFWLTTYLFVLLTATFAFFRLGPVFERWLFPVVTFEARFAKLQHEGVTFTLQGQKHRDCQLELLTTAWRFDSTTEVAPVYDSITGAIYQAPKAIEANEYFSFGPLYVPFTPAVYSLDTVELRGIAYYNCHNLWQTSHIYRLRVYVPAPPAQLSQTPYDR